MECRKCNTKMRGKDIKIDIYIDDELDIVITCPKCGHKINGFVDTKNFEDIE